MNDEPGYVVWAIRYSNGWRYTDDTDSVRDARERGLRVITYTRSK